MPRSRFPLLVVLVMLLAVPSAPASAAGLWLRWNDCHADGGVPARTFACDTNAGSEALVGSFVLGAGTSEVSGLEMYVVVHPAANAFPNWWAFRNPGTCRMNALTASFLPSSPTTGCPAWGTPDQLVGEFNVYPIAIAGGQSGYSERITLVSAVPPTALASLAAGQEYFAFRMNITHAKTVGTGACSGCQDATCIALGKVKVTHQDPSLDVSVTNSAGPDGQFASWQGGVHGAVYPVPNETGTSNVYTMECSSGATGNRHSTWGAIKSLYR